MTELYSLQGQMTSQMIDQMIRRGCPIPQIPTVASLTLSPRSPDSMDFREPIPLRPLPRNPVPINPSCLENDRNRSLPWDKGAPHVLGPREHARDR
jgi:hypothetical protein